MKNLFVARCFVRKNNDRWMLRWMWRNKSLWRRRLGYRAICWTIVNSLTIWKHMPVRSRSLLNIAIWSRPNRLTGWQLVRLKSLVEHLLYATILGRLGCFYHAIPTLSLRRWAAATGCWWGWLLSAGRSVMPEKMKDDSRRGHRCLTPRHTIWGLGKFWSFVWWAACMWHQPRWRWKSLNLTAGRVECSCWRRWWVLVMPTEWLRLGQWGWLCLMGLSCWLKTIL